MHAVAGPFDRFGTLRCVDFLQFYAAGWLVWSGRAEGLYDWEVFARTFPTLVPASAPCCTCQSIRHRLALSSRRLEPFHTSARCRSGPGFLRALRPCDMARHARLPALRPYRVEAWSLALGFTPFVQLIAHGQVASLAVPLLVVALYRVPGWAACAGWAGPWQYGLQTAAWRLCPGGDCVVAIVASDGWV